MKLFNCYTESVALVIRGTCENVLRNNSVFAACCLCKDLGVIIAVLVTGEDALYDIAV